MEVLLRLKPKVRPYIVMIAVLAVLVIITALALAATFSEYGYPILLIGLLVLLLCVLMIMQQLYRRWYTTYDITDTDVTSRFGVFAPDEHVVPVDEITDVDVDRSMFGIILGFGDINIDTASAEKGYGISMRDIDAAELSKAVELLRSLIKQRRGGAGQGGKASDSKTQ
ncbi:PH domain-containing protein [Candidatus Micrarchaeota archaeon]|nr:PH domain-containing protein [Candidatus Micrarchaeota archaeon]